MSIEKFIIYIFFFAFMSVLSIFANLTVESGFYYNSVNKCIAAGGSVSHNDEKSNWSFSCDLPIKQQIQTNSNPFAPPTSFFNEMKKEHQQMMKNEGSPSKNQQHH